MAVCETIKMRGGLIELSFDHDTPDPSHDFLLWKFAIFHRRFCFGNIHKPEQLKELRESGEIVAIKPLFMYEHGGFTLKSLPFDDKWDSGQIGYVYLTRNDAEGAGVTVDDALAIVNQEIETMDQWLNGDVFLYEIFRSETCPHCNHTEHKIVDICGGFYGIDYCRDSAIESAAEYGIFPLT